jgi:hypothetical protein
MSEKRLGKTGVWEFVMFTKHGTVLARSEWGINYEFDPMFWELLPVCP